MKIQAATHSAGAVNIGRGMLPVRIVDDLLKDKYAVNSGKLPAWISVSHIKRPAKVSRPSTLTP